MAAAGHGRPAPVVVCPSACILGRTARTAAAHLPPARTDRGTWQTGGVDIFGGLRRTISFSWQIRVEAWTQRLRQLTTIAIVFGSIGTAVGYALARRGVVDVDDLDDVLEAGTDG